MHDIYKNIWNKWERNSNMIAVHQQPTLYYRINENNMKPPCHINLTTRLVNHYRPAVPTSERELSPIFLSICICGNLHVELMWSIDLVLDGSFACIDLVIWSYFKYWFKKITLLLGRKVMSLFLKCMLYIYGLVLMIG